MSWSKGWHSIININDIVIEFCQLRRELRPEQLPAPLRTSRRALRRWLLRGSCQFLVLLAFLGQEALMGVFQAMLHQHRCRLTRLKVCQMLMQVCIPVVLVKSDHRHDARELIKLRLDCQARSLIIGVTHWHRFAESGLVSKLPDLLE